VASTEVISKYSPRSRDVKSSVDTPFYGDSRDYRPTVNTPRPQAGRGISHRSRELQPKPDLRMIERRTYRSRHPDSRLAIW
jgi:hypothetical protein